MSSYYDFVKSKQVKKIESGFEIKNEWLNPNLFDYQKEIVKRACKNGRYALFMDTGLGKSITQLNFAYAVHKHTKGRVLLLAPLAVVFQMIKEAQKFGFDLSLVENGTLKDGLNIINYEQLDNIKDLDTLQGIILDESSILKSYTGTTKRSLINKFKQTPYRLACTATPSPNDLLELGNHSEFLGVMDSYEMILRFFINDQMKMGGYRLKKHAVESFWQWISSWAECISSPADLGFNGDLHILPPLNEVLHEIRFDNIKIGLNGNLFGYDEINATTIARNKKASLDLRIKKLKEILNKDNTPHLVWVDTNEESAAVMKELKESFNCVEVKGSDSANHKATALNDFANGLIDILITKTSIAGFGMNFQNAHNMTFLGLNYSYEKYYQAIRRMYRFGQQNKVNVNVILADSERTILTNLKQKEQAHNTMKAGMLKAVNNAKRHNDLSLEWQKNLNIPDFIQTKESEF